MELRSDAPVIPVTQKAHAGSVPSVGVGPANASGISD